MAAKRSWRKKLLSPLIHGDIKTKLLILLAVLLVIIVIGAIIAVSVFRLSAGDALWWSWTHVIDPGFIGDDKDAVTKKVFGSFFSILGLLLLGGAFITLSEEAARRVIERMMNGSIPDDISGHTIIAGRGERLKAFIKAAGSISSTGDTGYDDKKRDEIIVVVPDQESLKQARDLCGHEAICASARIWDDDSDSLGTAVARRLIILENFAGDSRNTGAMLKIILRTLETRKNKKAVRNSLQPLTIYAEVNDFSLSEALRYTVDDIEGNTDDVEIHILNISAASARLSLRCHPLDCIPVMAGKSGSVVLVIDGWTPFARALFWQTLRTAHFPSKPTRIIIIHQAIEKIKSEINEKAPGLNEQWCRDTLVCIDFQKTHDIETINLTSQDIVTIAVCRRNQDAGFTRALEFREISVPGIRQIFLELPDNSGYRQAVEKLKTEIPIYPVGAGAEAFELAEKLDAHAKRLHKGYIEQRENNNKRIKRPDGQYENRSDYDWEELDEIRRNWNRSAADHIEVKLRAFADFLGLPQHRPVYDPVEGKLDFSGLHREIAELVISGADSGRKDLELLARLEHDRWNAEKLAEGWKFGQQKDESRKLNPCLVPYENLTEEFKGYDRKGVLDILGETTRPERIFL